MVIVTVTRTLAWGLSIGVLRAHAISTAARGLSGALPLALVLMWTLQTAGIAFEGAVIVVDSTHSGSFYPEVRLVLDTVCVIQTLEATVVPGCKSRGSRGTAFPCSS